jgi:putative transposase
MKTPIQGPFQNLKVSSWSTGQTYDTLDEARIWVAGFQQWYNEEHQHSAIKFVTLGQRHR